MEFFEKNELRQRHQYHWRTNRLLRKHEDRFALFSPFGKCACVTRSGTFNWTLGPQPILPKTRLLVSLSKTVNKPLTWHSQIDAGQPAFGWYQLLYSRQILWINVTASASFCMGFRIGCHGNGCPYLRTDHLCIESFPGLMHCVAAYCSRLHASVLISGHSLGMASQTSCDSIWTQQDAVHYCQRCDWYCLRPVTANGKQTKFQQWNYPHLFIIPHYLWHFNRPHSIISRSVVTADLFGAVHYRNTDQEISSFFFFFFFK